MQSTFNSTAHQNQNDEQTGKDTAINKDKISELDCYAPVYSTYGIQFIKTIRSDAFDYYDKFVGAILGKHKEPLRRKKTAQQTYKVAVRDKKVQILKADETGKFLPPQYSVEEKQGKSKKMSLTVISSKQQYLTEIFGRYIEGPTIGIIFFTESGGDSEIDKQIILPSLIFKKDSGTVGRTFYFESAEMAQEYLQNKGLHVTVQQLIDDALETRNTDYNEVLSRLQWLPNDPRCHIGIFYGSLTAKLLAQLRALDLKINTNADYIPITFYNGDNKESPFRGYLLEERQADVEAGLLLYAYNDDDEIKIIKSMAFLIKKHEESQLSNDIVLNDEEREKFLTVLINFKFTKTTIIKFIKLICASGEYGDVNTNICAVYDRLLTLVNNNQKINSNIITALLEAIENINDESVIKKFCSLFNKTSSNDQEKIGFLEKTLEKVIIDLSPEVVMRLLEAIPYRANEDAKLNYLEKILNKIKITDLNVGIIKQLLKAIPYGVNADVKLNYLEKILNKIIDLNAGIIEQLLNIFFYYTNADAKLNYLEKILNKITDLNAGIIERLLQAIPYDANADAKLNYLEKILNRANNLNADIDDNSATLFIYSLYQLNVELENKMKLLNKFKLPAILKVIKTIQEQELNTGTYYKTQQLQEFLDTISTNLTTRKRANSPSLVLFTSSTTTKDHPEYTTHEQPPEKKMRHYYTQ